MSMIARVRALLIALLLPALLGSAVLHALTLRDALREQLRQRNQDAAAMLALALAQQQGNPALLALVVAAQFDTGHYRSIVLQDSAGRPLVERRAAAPPPQAPDWFAAALPLDSAPGVAQVSTGWQALGRLEVATHAAWAHGALWSALLRSLSLLALLGALAALAAGAALRAWRRPLADTVAQARSLEEGRFVLAEEPAIPELRQVTRSMNSLVGRLREQFGAQATEVERLRRQAHLDVVSGLPHRRHTLSLLDAALADAPGGHGMLLIVRLCALVALNQRLGHDGTDRLLAALAQGLQDSAAEVEGAFAGRLNGSDFLLYLPHREGGARIPDPAAARSRALWQAQRTAQALRNTLRAALGGIDTLADFAVGAVNGHRAGTATRLLAAADLALARAEAAGPYGMDVASAVGEGPAGDQDWRRQLEVALAAAQVELAEHPVRAREGGLLMHECPLRLQLQPDAAFEPAARWLPMAARHGLTPAVDLAALDLALRAIARDGATRCVYMATASLASVGFVAIVRARLENAPQAASALWIELPETAASACRSALVDAATDWRHCGVRVGLGHAGDALRQLPALPALGLDFVKVDGRHLRGLATDAKLRDFARALAALVRPLGLRLLAGGIVDEADLLALWAIGFDAATGPAVV